MASQTNNAPHLHVAIIGSGPAGFYTAQALFRARPDIQVDLYERLPSPFGLVRSGVAPDHQKLKRPIQVYEQIADHENFNLVANVTVGVDLSIAALKQHYHAVVLANGTESGRLMHIPGEHLTGCHSATAFVGWYNGHPDFRDYVFDLSHETAVIVGQGNVAIDVCRILTKTADELRHTDIAEHALDALAESRIREVYLVGRRGPVQAKFTYQELKELTKLSACALETPAEELILNPASEAELEKNDGTTRGRVRNYETLKTFAIESPSTKPRRCTLRFLLSPIGLKGDQRLQQVIFERNHLTGPPGQQTAIGTGEYETIACGLLLSSIGYHGTPMAGVPFDSAQGIIPNDQGRVIDDGGPVPGLYAVGWVKRGPTGLIGTNKADAKETVSALLSDLSNHTQSVRVGLEGILPLLKQQSIRAVDFADWQKIDQHEIERGLAKDKPREKFTRVGDMLSVVPPESDNP